MKDYPEELQKAAGSRHQKMEISKNSSSSATVQNDVKYVRLWTEAEDKILREYYAAEGSKGTLSLKSEISRIPAEEELLH